MNEPNRLSLHEQLKVLDTFRHHVPNEKQIERISRLRLAARTYAGELMAQCPKGGDLDAVILKLRETNQLAIASVVLDVPTDDEDG